MSFTGRIINPTLAADQPGGGTLLTGLVSWWSCDETGTGNRLDSHGAHDLVSSTGVTNATGKVNNGTDFDNTSSAILQVAHADFDVAEWSICGWVQRKGGQNDDLFGLCASGDLAFCLHFRNANDVRFYASLNGTTWSGPTDATGKTYSADDWGFIVATYDASDILRVYEDGSEIYNNDYSAGPISTAAGFTAGWRQDSTNYSNAVMDEMAMWSRAITPAEVTTLYNSGSGLGYGDL